MDNTALSAIVIKIREDVDRAQHRADEAMNALSAHETLCALRYKAISDKLDIIPDIFKKIDGMSSKLSVATGVWIGVLGVGAIAGIMFTLTKLAHP